LPADSGELSVERGRHQRTEPNRDYRRRLVANSFPLTRDAACRVFFFGLPLEAKKRRI